MGGRKRSISARLVVCGSLNNRVHVLQRAYLPHALCARSGTVPSAAFAPGSVKVALSNTTGDFEKNMKADFSAGEVRGEACWGGAAEEKSNSIFLPSHPLFRLAMGLDSKITNPSSH